MRFGIPESQPWERSNAAAPGRARAPEGRRGAWARDEQALTRFTLVDLFSEPEIRRRTILAFLCSLTTTLAWWGISTWVPPYVGSVAAKAGLPAQQWASYAALAYNAGGDPRLCELRLLRRSCSGASPSRCCSSRWRSAHAGPVPVDAGFDASSRGRRDQRVLQPRPIFVDAGVAAGTVPDPHARHRHGVRVQRAALHRLPRALCSPAR